MGSNSIKEILKKSSTRSDQIFDDRCYLFSIYWIEENFNKYVNMFIFSLFQQLLCQSANECVSKLSMSDKLFWLYMSFLFSEKIVEKYQYHNKYRLVKCQSWISYFSVIPYEDWRNRKLQYCDRNFVWRLVVVLGARVWRINVSIRKFVIMELPTLNFIAT